MFDVQAREHEIEVALAALGDEEMTLDFEEGNQGLFDALDGPSTPRDFSPGSPGLASPPGEPPAEQPPAASPPSSPSSSSSFSSSSDSGSDHPGHGSSDEESDDDAGDLVFGIGNDESPSLALAAYPGSPHTLKVFLLRILKFSADHKLSMESLELAGDPEVLASAWKSDPAVQVPPLQAAWNRCRQV